MTDGLSTLYRDSLGGSYDCVDRIVLNAYFRMGHDPGGFRVWWRALTGSEETPENAYLMRPAGRFSRRIRGYAKAHDIPVIDCSAGQRKHDLAEEYLAKTKVTQGLFLVLVGRAQAPVWTVGANHHIERKKPFPYVNHYSFHVLDRDWGHLTIKISGHPPFPAQVMLNGHEYVACQARKAGISFTKQGNCFTTISDAAALAKIADTSALDWLGREQPFIEAQLARRHLKDGALLLYDVTSTYLEGRCCELAQHGYSRDHRGDRPQIVLGLMCAADGCPVAVEVFEGNTADPMTLSSQIDKLKQRFKLQRVVMVGDRGLLTSARIEQTLRPAGLDWITALRAPAIRQLAAEGGPLQPSLFDSRDMAEITSPDYPGERLVVCKNPLLAEERARKREELLAVTENDLPRIAAAVQQARRPLRGAAAIGQAVGAVLGRRHMAKHFHITIADDRFSFAQNPASIAADAALDGIYVVRTNLPAAHCDAAATVRAYKSLSGVEHAFRSLKTVDLELRPVFHWTAPRVRAHVLLCMLAYYLQWHMRQSLAPRLSDEPDPAAREAQRTSVVAKAKPSPAAHRKASRKRTDPIDGELRPVHSFHTLLGDLATLTRNVVRLGRDRLTAILATPTRTQHRAFDLLGVTPTA